jgi:glycosyltransferase involved in cell wall biosynthesis
VLPSLYESFGTPILEAMCSGCPVVTSDRYGTAEIAGDAAILVDPENVDSIADGMEQVVTNQQLRQRLVAAGHRRAGDFSWEKCARETLKVLDRLE